MPKIFSSSGRHFSHSTIARTSRRAEIIQSLTFVAILLLSTRAEAWRVIDTFRIPSGTTMMCAVNNTIWCGSNSADSTILVINPATGEVEDELHAPDRACRGLTFSNGSIWFLSTERLFRLNAQAQVQSSMNVPFAGMMGLAPGDNSLWSVDRTDGAPALVEFNSQGGLISRLAMRVSDAWDIDFNGTNFWISSPPDGFIHQLAANGNTVNIFPTPTNTPSGITLIGDDVFLVDAGDDEAGDILYRISPTADPAPRILASGYLHHYSVVNVFGAAVWDLTLYNVGTAELEITRVAFLRGNQNFIRGQLPQRMVLAPAQFLNVRITFSPDAYGFKTDDLEIRSNDELDSVFVITCDGIGIYPERLLGFGPETLDFGDVRADNWRDGSKHMDLNIFNMGSDPVRVQQIRNGIPDVFEMEVPELPYELAPTDTLVIRVWFTPTRAINFLDTVTVISTAVNGYDWAYLRGHGDDTVYPDGEILWETESETPTSGGIAIGGDVNNDGIREVYTFGPEGSIECINGFSSVAGDALWIQSFERYNFSPPSIADGTQMSAGISLSGQNTMDVLFATGGEDASVYALSGRSGELLWRWTARYIDGSCRIVAILPGSDVSGTGIVSPMLLLTNDEDVSYLVRLDGHSGRTVWYSQFHAADDLLEIGDLTVDGIPEYVIYGSDGRVVTVDGSNGRTIRSFVTRRLNRACATDQSLVDFPPTLFCAAADNGIFAVNLISGQTRWTVDRVGEIGAIGLVNDIRFSTDGDSALLISGDEHGRLILIFDPATGRDVLGANLTELSIRSVAWAPALHPEYAQSVLAGDEGGNIFMLEASNLERLWSFAPDRDRGFVKQLSEFDDVDLGGTADILALFESGEIACISSGGDFNEVHTSDGVIPDQATLSHLYPNPFNGSLNIEVTLGVTSPVKLTAFDSQGRLIGSTDYGTMNPGTKRLPVSARLTSGVNGTIFLKVEIGSESTVLRSVYLK